MGKTGKNCRAIICLQLFRAKARLRRVGPHSRSTISSTFISGPVEALRRACSIPQISVRRGQLPILRWRREMLCRVLFQWCTLKKTLLPLEEIIEILAGRVALPLIPTTMGRRGAFLLRSPEVTDPPWLVLVGRSEEPSCRERV